MQTVRILSSLAVTLLCQTALAEVPSLSPDKLKRAASHIVIGKVRAVYTTTKKSKNWEETKSVAEIAVAGLEKGNGIDLGDVVYAHYWNKKWVGVGDPDPDSTGHLGVRRGDVVRAHLERKDGSYHVLLPNGFVSLNADDAEAHSKANDVAERELAKVQGTWARTLEVRGERFRILKNHDGNKTTMMVTDSKGRVVEEKTSEFRLDTAGKVRVFTYFNNVFTAGPSKGQTEKEPQSYVYRVTGDTFVEFRGLLIGTDERVSAFTWKRVKE